jgi:hypothetical protein
MICQPDPLLIICRLVDGFILESEIGGFATLTYGTIEGSILIEANLVAR